MLHPDGETIVDQPEGRRENFVPLHTTDIIQFLTLYPGLSTEQQTSFHRIASLILSLLHHLYRQRHEQLTYTYAPLDPDRDSMLRSVPTSPTRDTMVQELFDQSLDALERANYHRLGPEDIDRAIHAASKWGVRMRVNLEMLRQLEVYARGSVIGQREYRDWRRCFRLETIDVPLYQRLVVLFRTSEDLETDRFDPRRVYFRMFKNVPQQDIDMMLPATGIQMSWLDHSKIVVPSLYAAGIAIWRFLRNVFLLAFFGIFKTLGIVVLILFAIGFGIKSMFTYRTNTRRRYMLSMAENLYYQNLDNNAGVLLRLLEEGEQQEACEAILAYFVCAVIFERSGPKSMREIDEACEEILLEATGLEVDFDVENTVVNLVDLGILVSTAEGHTALPFPAAIEQLDNIWDNWFR